jgi:membrane-bound lytic murein transglycosylase D
MPFWVFVSFRIIKEEEMRTALIILIVVITCCSEPDRMSSQPNIDQQNHFTFISSVDIPDELNFCGEEIPLDNPEVRERAEREFYLLMQQPGQIILYLKRSGRYFPMYERIIADNGMPDDLKYLSVAESALYMARSAKDAVGLWQFIPSTAKVMGLTVNDYVDERRHPEKSTIAAMKYLRDGYAKHGSWILTVAGYNMGHTGVTQSLSYQNADDYFDLFLNEETSRFIFRIAIIKEIMKNHEKYGFSMDEEDWYQPYKTRTIKETKNITDLHTWAIENGTTYKWVKLLNPWILQRRLPSPPKGQTWEILIPE